MFLRLIAISFILVLSGCALVPESLEVPEGTQLVSYNRAVTGGDAVRGQTARWGGIIVGVENKPQKTLIEVVHFPVNHYGKPNTSEDTIGRFKAQINGFVDPIIFEEGRPITFVGSVEQPTAGMVGEQPYMYPTLNVQDYHLWRKETVYDVSTLYFNYGTGWYSPFYHPFYRPGWGFGMNGFGHSRVRVIERSNFRPTVKPQPTPAVKRSSSSSSRSSISRDVKVDRK
ncbi:Slp family lipoprotein [Alteromonas pelagimontana]|uniref:Slp family lipoprotein n=1 Tax=Alteromonas pelagimontana TaxID=1858656 RepID=A0A6M4MGF2_9ALTE|nr:Slp family lipoprotein [Alteromonas pelagimontana]QJR82199.1 Slp family lipoprotein [Alteromonas pelagimontana]